MGGVEERSILDAAAFAVYAAEGVPIRSAAGAGPPEGGGPPGHVSLVAADEGTELSIDSDPVDEHGLTEGGSAIDELRDLADPDAKDVVSSIRTLTIDGVKLPVSVASAGDRWLRSRRSARSWSRSPARRRPRDVAALRRLWSTRSRCSPTRRGTHRCVKRSTCSTHDG